MKEDKYSKAYFGILYLKLHWVTATFSEKYQCSHQGWAVTMAFEQGSEKYFDFWMHIEQVLNLNMNSRFHSTSI